MKILKLEDCEYELLLEVFNDAISYARKRNQDKTVKDYRHLLATLIIESKGPENHG